MKWFTTLLVVTLFVITGCNKIEQPVFTETKTSSVSFEQNSQNFNPDEFNLETVRMISVYKMKMAKSGKMPVIASSTDIVVPDDYPTIQDAIDAAAENVRIKVEAGTYDENIIIMTDGLEIMAVGDVVVNGGFTVQADDVTIQGFTINIRNQLPGIRFNSSEDGIAKNNIITGGRAGVVFYQSNGCTAKNNTSYDNQFGFVIIAGDYNVIKNNYAYENTSRGIDLEYLGADYPEHNEIWGNNCNNNLFGIYLIYSNNNLVKVNICEYNTTTGIVLVYSNNNNVEENRALYNTVYDIRNYNGLDNTFTNNNAEKTLGF